MTSQQTFRRNDDAGRMTAAAPEARLLVVDDEPNIVDLLATSLRFAGFEVATARNGSEALRLAPEFRP
ncbi:MAG: two-component system, OmpR family, response regulator, partial [Frankiaceae bacterium]|nr:two-component system, OmpR family, response regulator [Frankiaceae bacterium]